MKLAQRDYHMCPDSIYLNENSPSKSLSCSALPFHYAFQNSPISPFSVLYKFFFIFDLFLSHSFCLIKLTEIWWVSPEDTVSLTALSVSLVCLSCSLTYWSRRCLPLLAIFQTFPLRSFSNFSSFEVNFLRLHCPIQSLVWVTTIKEPSWQAFFPLPTPALKLENLHIYRLTPSNP